MSIDKLINLLVTLTLFEMMAAIGLGVTLGEIAGAARNKSLVTRCAVANYLFVAAMAVGLLLLFHAHPMVAAGIPIAAVSPGAPYGPPFMAMAKGSGSMIQQPALSRLGIHAGSPEYRLQAGALAEEES
jgi:predicted Na+-dependent transporter